MQALTHWHLRETLCFDLVNSRQPKGFVNEFSRNSGGGKCRARTGRRQAGQGFGSLPPLSLVVEQIVLTWPNFNRSAADRGD